LHADPSSQGVEPGVCRRGLDRDRIRVHAEHSPPEPGGGDCQDPDPQPTSRTRTPPGAHAAAAAERGRCAASQQPLVGEGLQGRETETRRRMEPGAEGHPGSGKHHVVGLLAMSPPRRPITSRRPIRSTGKWLFQASANPPRSRGEPEGARSVAAQSLQVPKAVVASSIRRAHDRPIETGQVGSDDGRLAGSITTPNLVDEPEARFHARSGGKAGQDLADRSTASMSAATKARPRRRLASPKSSSSVSDGRSSATGCSWRPICLGGLTRLAT